MEGRPGGSPTPVERAAKASRVELYGCKDCGAQTRFLRYNDPGKLLETRTVSPRAVVNCVKDRGVAGALFFLACACWIFLLFLNQDPVDFVSTFGVVYVLQRSAGNYAAVSP